MADCRIPLKLCCMGQDVYLVNTWSATCSDTTQTSGTSMWIASSGSLSCGSTTPAPTSPTVVRRPLTHYLHCHTYSLPHPAPG